MKIKSITILRITVLLIGAILLALCIGLTWAIKDEGDFNYWGYIVLITLYLTSVATFFAIYQTIKLLKYIDQKEGISDLPIIALRNIKYCAFIISIIYTINIPFFYYAAQLEDAPGIMLIGFAMAFAPFVIGVFISVFQELLQDTLAIKTEK